MKPTSKAAAKISSWLTEAPAESESLRLTAKKPLGGDEILVEIRIEELKEKRSATEYAEYLTGQCEQWADTLNRECSFLLQWLANERPVATLQFRCGPFDASAVPIDGTPESFLLQMQATLLAKDKTMLEMVKVTGESYQNIITLLSDRLVTLERDRLQVETQRVEMARQESDLLGDAQETEKFKHVANLLTRLIEAGTKDASKID